MVKFGDTCPHGVPDDRECGACVTRRESVPKEERYPLTFAGVAKLNLVVTLAWTVGWFFGWGLSKGLVWLMTH